MTIQDFTALLGVVGGIILFGFALYQWNNAQQWRRAEKLDALIKEFDTEPLLVLGRVVLDWTWRTISHNDDQLKITNTEALLALRVHHELPEGEDDYPGNQALIRDALDCMLGFFEKLEIALTTRLVDTRHAKRFFGYWLDKLVTYSAHPIDDESKQTRAAANGSPAARVAGYIAGYGNVAAIVELCTRLGVEVPRELQDAQERAAQQRAAA